MQKKCPCKSGLTYQECCGPCHRNHALASTPEKLMRSRFSGFVLQLDDYLRETWFVKNRPKQIVSTESGVQWLHLVVNESGIDESDPSKGWVSFTAYYTDGKGYYTLKEKSRFTKVNGLWFYVDGNAKTDKLSIKRSSSCLCGSGKKFKRCCGKLHS